MDGKHVVFGQVESGHAVVKVMEAMGTDEGSVRANIVIARCGELPGTPSTSNLLLHAGGKKKKPEVSLHEELLNQPCLPYCPDTQALHLPA